MKTLLLRWKWTITLAVIVLLALWSFWSGVRSSQACEDAGGTYVRGFFGYECIGYQGP